MSRKHMNPLAPGLTSDSSPTGGRQSERANAQGREERGGDSFCSESPEADASFMVNSVHSLSQALRTYDMDSLDNSRNVVDGDAGNSSHRYSVASSFSAYDFSRGQDSDTNARLEASPGNRRGRSASGRGREADGEHSYRANSESKLNSSTQKVFLNFINSSFSGRHDANNQPLPTPNVARNRSFSRKSTNSSFGMMPGSASLTSGPLLQSSGNGSAGNENFARWTKSLSANESQATLPASLGRNATSFSHSTVPLIKPHASGHRDKANGKKINEGTKASASLMSTEELSKIPSLQESIPFPFFIEQLRTRMKFNEGLQDIAVFTIFAIFMCFFTTYHPSGIERMFYVSASLFERFSQKEFPSPQRQLDAYRQRVYFFNTSSWVTPDKYYLDISNHQEWRWYVTDVLMQSFIAPFEAVGSAAGLDVNSSTIGNAYGQMFGLYPVGSLRIRTIRMADFTCDLQTSFYPSAEEDPDFPRDCWRPGTNAKYEETNATLCPDIMNPLSPNESLFQYRKPTHLFGTNTLGINAVYHDGGYYFDIPFTTNVSMMKQFQNALGNMTCNFVDSWATRLASFSMYFYAPATDTWHRVRYRSEVKAAGWHLNSAVQRPFEVYSPRMLGQVVFTGFVLLIFALFCGTLVYQSIYMFKVDPKLLKMRALSMLFYVDLLLILTTITVFTFWFRWLHACLRIRDKLHFPFDDDSILPDLAGIQNNYEFFNLMCAVDLCFISIRLVRIFELWAPLLTITQSLLSDNSIKTLMSICVMFIISFIGFGLGGWAMFGCYSECFETISSSFMYLIQLNFGFNTIYPVMAGNRGVFFFFLFSYYIVESVLFTFSVTATLSWTFTSVNSKYFLAYDVAWFGRYLQSLWKTFRWYRIRRFFRVLFGIQRETQYLHEICDVLQAYVHEKLEADTRKSMIHLSVSQASASSTTTTAPLNTPSRTSTSSAVEKDEREEHQPLLGNDTNTATTATAATAAAAAAAATAIAKLTDELADNEYTFKRLSVDSYKITFQQLLDLVPQRLYAHCGGIVFFTDLWRETVESLHDFRQTPEQLEVQARRTCTKDLTMKVMKQELLKIEKLNMTIYNLESHVANLRNALQVHNMSFVDEDE